MCCYNAAMKKPLRFSMRRLFVATTLIAVGSAAFADLRTAAESAPPMSALNVIEALSSFPLIGAGLFTPIKRPVLGACLGAISFFAFLWWLAAVTGAMSV
jgi:hypothetical protein